MKKWIVTAAVITLLTTIIVFKLHAANGCSMWGFCYNACDPLTPNVYIIGTNGVKRAVSPWYATFTLGNGDELHVSWPCCPQQMNTNGTWNVFELFWVDNKGHTNETNMYLAANSDSGGVWGPAVIDCQNNVFSLPLKTITLCQQPQ